MAVFFCVTGDVCAFVDVCIWIEAEGVSAGRGSSSAVKSIDTSLLGLAGRDPLACAFVPLPLIVGLSSSESNADRARPNGVDISFVIGFGSLAVLISVPCVAVGFCCFTDSSVVGVGVGEADTIDPDFFLLTIPPPKKLFKVCCLPLNSSKNFVANRGGSGAVRGGSVG